MALLALMTAISLGASFVVNGKSEELRVVEKQLADERAKLTALSSTVAQRRVSPALATELASAKAMLSAHQDVLLVLESRKWGNRQGFSGFMSAFARQSQSDPWLTGFLITVGGDEIEIHGRLLDPARLPAYVQRLSTEPVFHGRRFAALEMRDVDPGDKKTDPPAMARVSEIGVAQHGEAKLPRYVEFVLRSENAVTLNAAARTGDKP
ncbi:hypothetical protein [Candidatus Accumulibacter aalborgensis]|uniref:hypothetical protein n=1 Tax=Candidatus Accumulibacter aalborgensis TaxID=1860102 RepID=UPI00164652F8|nr:hypothetical protein [Candidatus Accumulibacter aalborgensis]